MMFFFSIFFYLLDLSRELAGMTNCLLFILSFMLAPGDKSFKHLCEEMLKYLFLLVLFSCRIALRLWEHFKLNESSVSLWMALRHLFIHFHLDCIKFLVSSEKEINCQGCKQSFIYILRIFRMTYKICCWIFFFYLSNKNLLVKRGEEKEGRIMYLISYGVNQFCCCCCFFLTD